MRDMVDYAMWCFRSSFHNVSVPQQVRNRNFYWRVWSLDKYLSREKVEVVKCDAAYFDDFRCLCRVFGLFQRCDLQQSTLDWLDGDQGVGALSVSDFYTEECIDVPRTHQKSRVHNEVQKHMSDAQPFLRTCPYKERHEAAYRPEVCLGDNVERYSVHHNAMYGGMPYLAIPTEQDSLLCQNGRHRAKCPNEYPAGIGGSAPEGRSVLLHMHETEKSCHVGLGCTRPRKVCRTAPFCAHCGATETSLWRRLGNSVVCNACGLYHRMHGIKRPASLRKSFIRKRRRQW